MLDNTSNDYLTYERYIFLSLLDTLTGLFFKFVSSLVKRDCSRLFRVVNFKRDSENIFIIFQSSILDPSKFYVFFFMAVDHYHSTGNAIMSIARVFLSAIVKYISAKGKLSYDRERCFEKLFKLTS